MSAAPVTAIRPVSAPSGEDGILVVKDVTKHFRTPDGVVTAVDNVSLSVKQGEFLAVIGPSGCGKSTLFNVVGGLLGDYEGEVSVAGERITGPHASSKWSVSTDSKIAIRMNCPAACASASRWRARWHPSRRFS
jgi:ABC-type oligopeptide transport system ATPase subunit